MSIFDLFRRRPSLPETCPKCGYHSSWRFHYNEKRNLMVMHCSRCDAVTERPPLDAIKEPTK